MEQKKPSGRSGTYWMAAIFIAIGVLLLGKNLGIIDRSLFRIIVSWQMLLVVIGFSLLTKKQYAGSLILIAAGVYFLMPKINIFNDILSIFFWPAVFILLGLVFIITRTGHPARFDYNMEWDKSKSTASTEEGFFFAQNSFGETRQMISDDIFKGGVIRNSFGSVVLDLRGTSLPEGTTYIDINTSFGGVEIYVPSYWNVKSVMHPFLGGYSDTRLIGVNVVNNDRTLVLRGNISFGGVDVKS